MKEVCKRVQTRASVAAGRRKEGRAEDGQSSIQLLCLFIFPSCFSKDLMEAVKGYNFSCVRDSAYTSFKIINDVRRVKS